MVEVKTSPAAEKQVFLAHLLKFKKPPQRPRACLQLVGLSLGYENTTRPSCCVQYLTKITSQKYSRHMNKILPPQLDIYIVLFSAGHV
jgi:hypothetical protein